MKGISLVAECRMACRPRQRNGRWIALGEKSIVQIDGKSYLRSEYTVDFGEKNGTARVTVLDPCVTEEAQRKRREAIVKKCEELIRRGLM